MSGCKDAEVVMPVVNLGRCEGAGDCLKVCPYDVFEIRKANTKERENFNFVEKLKSFVHGHKKAFVINPSLCHNCGLCVSVCPEKAIKLTTFS